MHISSSYAKINFQSWEIPQSGSKAKDGERKKERKKEDRKLVITMASYALQRHLGWRTQSCLGQNTPGKRVGPGSHDQTLALKSRKNANFLNIIIRFDVRCSAPRFL